MAEKSSVHEMIALARTRTDYLRSDDCKTRALLYLRRQNYALYTFLTNKAASARFSIPGYLHLEHWTRYFISRAP